MNVNLSKLWEFVKDTEDWHAAVHGSQIVGYNWVTELKWIVLKIVKLCLKQTIIFAYVDYMYSFFLDQQTWKSFQKILSEFSEYWPIVI